MAIKNNCLDLEKEVIVIDDGSTDGTKEILDNLQIRFKDESGKILIYHSPSNIGKGACIRTGLK